MNHSYAKMTYIALPDDKPRDASFYLALEEFVARRVDCDEAFFLWQIGPSVVFGRNQIVRGEIDLDYCRANGVATFRRKSGGGCIYADRGNVMFSYVGRGENVAALFARYTERVVALLRSLGVEAEATGRNDVTIAGRKVSGTAFYQLQGRSIVHGTMLYDSDTERMVRCLTPTAGKLRSKGVESVRQRVAFLKDHLDIGLAEFMERVRAFMCDRTLTLSPGDVAAVGRIEREYSDPAFVFDSDPPYELVRSRRFENCGEVEARVSIRHGRVRDVYLAGDFFLLSDPAPLLDALRGTDFTPQAVDRALATVDPGHYVRHFRRRDLLTLLFEDDNRNPHTT